MKPEPQTSTGRVRAIRERRQALGLTRCELYAHPADFPALKALAAKLKKARERLAGH